MVTLCPSSNSKRRSKPSVQRPENGGIRTSKLNPSHPRIFVGYRDLEAPKLINDLCFILPALVEPDDRVFVIAHPEGLTPDLVGLYIEKEGVRQDQIADFKNLDTGAGGLAEYHAQG